jgi:bleomycin hydrolase
MRIETRIFILMLTLISTRLAAQADSAFYAEKFIWTKMETVLTMDFSRIDRPMTLEEASPVFHNPSVRQDTTGTCWAFSGISFLESEIKRIHNREFKLSEMYSVYWEYVEKVRRYVREKGNSLVDEGSEEDGVILRMKQYGAVRDIDYTGLPEGQTRHNHGPLMDEIKSYLDYVKENSLWDEEIVLAHVKMVLDKHLGRPPDMILYKGDWITPRKFLEEVLRLPLADYVSFMSFKSVPFYTQGKYDVPDNWWLCDQYYNVPLDDWYNAIKQAIGNGYSLAIGGDVSEPGKGRELDIAVIPSFDIPGDAINQDAREYRFYNESSTDDHGIHLVGYVRKGDRDWFLVKDSGSSAQEGNLKGYFFFRDDWIRLKMLTFTVHKDAVADLLKKCGAQ